MEQGYFGIRFSNETSYTAERMITMLKSYCVEITTVDGETGDYELVGYGEWDGHKGQPMLALPWDDDLGCGNGEPVLLDAETIYIH